MICLDLRNARMMMTNIEVTLSNYPVVAGRSCWNVSYQTVLVRQYGTTNTTTVLSLTALLTREEPFRNNKEEPTDLIYFDGKFSWVPTFTRSLRTYLKFTNLKKINLFCLRFWPVVCVCSLAILTIRDKIKWFQSHI